MNASQRRVQLRAARRLVGATIALPSRRRHRRTPTKVVRLETGYYGQPQAVIEQTFNFGRNREQARVPLSTILRRTVR